MKRQGSQRRAVVARRPRAAVAAAAAMKLLAVPAVVLALVACTGIPDPEAEGLGEPCTTDDDCPGVGQSCHTYPGGACDFGECRTCEVVCDSDYDCPDGRSCNVPPLPPDTVPQICE